MVSGNGSRGNSKNSGRHKILPDESSSEGVVGLRTSTRVLYGITGGILIAAGIGIALFPLFFPSVIPVYHPGWIVLLGVFVDPVQIVAGVISALLGAGAIYAAFQS